MRSASDIVDRVRQLPSLEPVINHLLASFEQSDIDVAHVAADIALDQALVARVLRLANSPFYGLAARVGSIKEAVLVLGFRNVRAAVVAIALTRCFIDRHVPGFDAREFWRHSTAVGVAARELARRCGREEDMAFTGGVIHDIGVLVLMTIAPDEMARVLEYCRQHGCMIRDGERVVLGVDHAALGALMARKWGLPAELCDGIALHHTPDDATADSLANIVHLADVIVRTMGLSGDESRIEPRVSDVALNRLGLTGSDLGAVMTVVAADLDAIHDALFS